MKAHKDFAFRFAPGPRRGVTYVALFYLMALFVLASCFLQEHIAFDFGGWTPYMNDVEFYVTFGVYVLLGTAFLLHVHRNFHLGIHWGWLILFVILCAGNVVGTFMMETHVSGTGLTVLDEVTHYDITFTLAERIRWSVGFGAACFMFYCMFAVFPKIFHNFRRLHFIWHTTILVAIAAIVYSLIAEWGLYATSFTGGEWMVTDAKSFTNNPNNFAYILMLAVCAICFLNARRSHWYWWALMFFFGLGTVIIGSGTCIIATWGLIVAYVIYRFFATLRAHPVKASFALAFFIGGFVTLLCLILNEVGPEWFFIARLGRAMKNSFFVSHNAEMRLRTWNTIFGLLEGPIKLIFGLGDRQTLFYLGGIECLPNVSLISYAHNGFMQALFNGGLLRVGIYLILVIRFGYLCVRSLKTGTRVAWAAILTFVALMARGMFETTAFLSAEGNGLSFFLIAMLPVEVDNFLRKHPEVRVYEDNVLETEKAPTYAYEYNPLRVAKLTFLFLTPIAALAIGYVPHVLRAFGFETPASYYVLWSFIYLIMPFAMYCIGHHASHVDRAVYGTLTALAFVGCSVAGSIVIYLVDDAMGYYFIAPASAVALVAFLCHRKSVTEIRDRLFSHGYVPHLIMLAFLLVPSVVLWFTPVNQASLYVAVIGPSVLSLAMYLNCLLSKYGNEIAYPLSKRLEAFDCRRTARGIHKERRLVDAQNKYMTKPPKEPKPGKTYYVHL